MSASATIAVDEPHRRIVLAILNAALPPGTHVAVFGSRASGRARRYSDLDLAIDAGRPLTRDETAALSEAFDECDVPWKVDIVDTHTIGAEFRTIIERQFKPLAVIGRDQPPAVS